MSWQAHVDELLASGRVWAAAVLRLDGKVFAQSAELSLAERVVPDSRPPLSEAKAVAEAGANGGRAAAGLWVNGVKYQLLNWDDERSVGYFKCVGGGATLVRTAKTLILGLWSQARDPAQTGGGCNVAVETRGDYFRSINY